jgi:hypothetical protein
VLYKVSSHRLDQVEVHQLLLVFHRTLLIEHHNVFLIPIKQSMKNEIFSYFMIDILYIVHEVLDNA